MTDKLLDSLVINTNNSQLQWQMRPTCFNSDTDHHYKCQLSDGSEIRIEINLDKDLKFSRCDYVKVVNKNLVNGELYISGYNESRIKSLGEIVYNKYLKPNIVPRAKTQDQVLLDIIDSIPSKQELRDRKINEIVGKSKSFETQKEKDDEKNVKPKSKLNRIVEILFGG